MADDLLREMKEALQRIVQLSVLPPKWRLPLLDGAATKQFSNDELLERLQRAVAIAEDTLSEADPPPGVR